MNLLFISNAYPPFMLGGYEQNCQNLAEILIKKGHRITILTSCIKSLPKEQTINQIKIYRTLVRPQVKRKKLNQSLYVCLKELIYYRSLIKKASFDRLIFWNLAGLNPLLLYLPLLTQHQPIFYLQDYHLRAFLVSESGILEKNFLQKILKFPLLFLLNYHIFKNSKALFVSKSLQKIYQQKGFIPKQKKIIYNGINLNHQTLRSKPSKKNRQKTKLICAGRITPTKGFHVAIEALALVFKKFPLFKLNTTLNIYGPITNKQYFQRLKNLIQKHKLTSNVKLHHELSRHQLQRMFRQHQILIFPSIWEEPFGLVLIEAMNAKLAIIASQVGGVKEIIKQNGILIPPLNPKILSEKIIYLITHPKSLSSYQKLAYQTSCQFDINHQADQFINFLEK